MKQVGVIMLLIGLILISGGIYIRMSVIYPPPEFSNPVSLVGTSISDVYYIAIGQQFPYEGALHIWCRTTTENTVIMIDNNLYDLYYNVYHYIELSETEVSDNDIDIKFVRINGIDIDNFQISIPLRKRLVICSIIPHPYYGGSVIHDMICKAELENEKVNNLYFVITLCEQARHILSIENENFIYSPENIVFQQENPWGTRYVSVVKWENYVEGKEYWTGYVYGFENMSLSGRITPYDCWIDIEYSSTSYEGISYKGKYESKFVGREFDNVIRNNKVITTSIGECFIEAVYDYTPHYHDEIWSEYSYIPSYVITTVFPLELKEVVIEEMKISNYLLFMGFILSFAGVIIILISPTSKLYR